MWYDNHIDKAVRVFSPLKDGRTRGQEVTLVMDQCRLDSRKYQFSQRIMQEWNILSTDCINASSIICLEKLTNISEGRKHTN